MIIVTLVNKVVLGLLLENLLQFKLRKTYIILESRSFFIQFYAIKFYRSSVINKWLDKLRGPAKTMHHTNFIC